ncbi:MAG: hypothetical protein HOV80_36690 [Polyangiaceae bacterium]|nr:hypothetical protein [Polyangiaceae bacterium]
MRRDRSVTLFAGPFLWQKIGMPAWRGIPFFVLFLLGCEGADDGGGAGGSAPEKPVGTKPRQGPPAFAVGGFSVQVPSITIQPGEELFPCFIAPLERTGPSRVVGGGTVTVGKGMHHGNITSRPKTGEGFRPCPDDGGLAGEAGDVLAGGAVLFGSTTQVEGQEWRTFPDGMGFPIGDDSEIVLRLHLLNTSQEPIDVAPKYEWFTIDEAQVTHLLGPLIWRYASFEIPPNAEATVTTDCTLGTAEPMHIVDMMPHMHKLGTAFKASFIGGDLDGQMFLDSPGYNPDGLITSFDPAVVIQPGDGFQFSCTWKNTFDKTILEGVGDNEMCMMFGYAWPYESALSAVAAPGGGCAMLPVPKPQGWE